MTDAVKDKLVPAALGDTELAEKVRALPRDDLEQVAASAIALAKQSMGPKDLGKYARRIVDHGLSTLVNTLRPLPEDAAQLIISAL